MNIRGFEGIAALKMASELEPIPAIRETYRRRYDARVIQAARRVADNQARIRPRRVLPWDQMSDGDRAFMCDLVSDVLSVI